MEKSSEERGNYLGEGTEKKLSESKIEYLHFFLPTFIRKFDT